MILFVHNQIAADNFPIIHQIAGCGVPGFFIISGFLFFRNIEVYTVDVYKKKLKNRVKTLLVPYLFWNIAAAFCSFVIVLYHYFHDGAPMNFWEQFNPWSVFVDYCHSGSPVHLVMWFVKDLLILIIISPLIFWIIKRTKIWFLLFLILFAIDILSIHIVGNLSIVAFSIGSYFSICHKENWQSILYSKSFCLGLVALLLVIAGLRHFELVGALDFGHLIVSLGALVCIPIIGRFNIGKKQALTMLSSASFFVYVVHIFQPFGGITIHTGSFWILEVILGKTNLVSLFFTCVLAPFMTFVVCYFLYKTLSKWQPRLLSIMTGCR